MQKCKQLEYHFDELNGNYDSIKTIWTKDPRLGINCAYQLHHLYANHCKYSYDIYV